MHRRAIYRFRRAARGERSAEAIDRFPQTASTDYPPAASRQGQTFRAIHAFTMVQKLTP